MEKILVINPGSTSTKIAVYEGNHMLFVTNIEHSENELAAFEEIFDQFEFRKELILKTMEDHVCKRNELSCVVARGGLLPPVKSGAYEVNEDMVWQLKFKPQNEHASNLGAAIAKSIADELNLKAYVYDPVTVDELIPVVRITGLPEMERKGMGHNLNMRATALSYASKINKPYQELRLIVAHLGGGITLSLHENGKMIDMISDDEGPFSPERAGGLPVFQVIDMMAASGGNKKEAMKKIKNQAGLYAYLGTKDAREVEKRIENGDKKAALIYEAMALNIAKNIAKLSVVVNGQVDAILLTGGIAHSTMLTDMITKKVGFIADVVCMPGENEMESLAFGALRVLRGEESAHLFRKVE